MTSPSSAGMGLLWFVLVVAAIPAALWLLKRTPYGAAMSGGAAAPRPPVRTIASMPLGPQQRLVTVEVGEGAERRWLVLGVTAHSISALHTLTPQGEPPVAAAPAALPVSFAALLDTLRRPGRHEVPRP